MSTSYQKGWIVEVRRAGWRAFKLHWRERTTGGKWVIRTRMAPRYQEDGVKPTLAKHAQQLLDSILADINTQNGGMVQVKPTVIFSDLVESYWKPYMVKQRMRPSTIDGYSSPLEKWINPFFGKMTISKIGPEDVTRFMMKLEEAKLASKYQKNIYCLLMRVFEIARTYDLIAVSPLRPLLHRPSVERKEKPVLPVEKLRDLFQAMTSFRDRAFYATLIMTGMRQGEALAVRRQDVDFVQGSIHKSNVVYRGELVAGLKNTRKDGKIRQHTVAMPEMLKGILVSIMETSEFKDPDSYVFHQADGKPLDPDHMRNYVLYPALDSIGVERTPYGFGHHMFRHMAATRIASTLGLKHAQQQLDHSDIQTTANIYTHQNLVQKHESASALEGQLADSATYLLPENC